MEIKSTADIALRGVTLLVYGQSGVGKTTLIKTIPGRKLILSAEGGLLSLQGTDIQYVDIHTMDELTEAFNHVVEHLEDFDCIILDSLSELAEVILSSEKKESKDVRQAYLGMQDQIMDLARAFRDLPVTVYMTAKQERVQSDSGRLLFGPSMPGQKLSQQLPYIFDEVLALRSETNENNENIRFIQTFSDSSWCSKDRSGKLDAYEDADLGKILTKIGGEIK